MEETSRVSLYGWDLKGFPKPVLKALKWIHKVNDGKTPKRLIHVGVAVFHKFYHFNQKGLQIAYEIPKKNVQLLPEPVTTTKSSQEFEEWFNSAETRDSFGSTKYHPVHKNCIDFALIACEFLGVPILPGFHTQLNDWLKGQDAILILFKSPKLLSFFGVAFGDASKRTFVDHPSDYGEEEEIDEDELIGWEEV